jgi:nitrate/TMAO reductase-like tetraheme cytochrome c subunit
MAVPAAAGRDDGSQAFAHELGQRLVDLAVAREVRLTTPFQLSASCGEQKDTGEFPVHRDKGDGFSSWCRDCHAEACAKWRAKHPEKVDAYNEQRRSEYEAKQEAKYQAQRKEMNKRLREQVRRNRERDERLRERFRETAA